MLTIISPDNPNTQLTAKTSPKIMIILVIIAGLSTFRSVTHATGIIQLAPSCLR